MLIIQKFENTINTCNRLIGKAVSVFTLLMALLMFSIVVLRYGFNVGWIAMQETLTYLHAAVFLLGAAYTYQNDGHVRVDVFYRRFSAKKQAVVNLVGALVFLIPTSLFITMVSWHYVYESWVTLEQSKESGGLPFLYLLKTMILGFSITLCLQGLAEVAKQGLFLSKLTDTNTSASNLSEGE